MSSANKFDRRERLLARMASIPDQVKQASERNLHAQAQFLVDQIKAVVPVDEGDLRDSVEWHPNPSDEKIAVVITEGLGQENDPLNRKARALEFGRPDMDAQPHFFPTFRAWKKKINSRVLAAGRKVIREIWGKQS